MNLTGENPPSLTLFQSFSEQDILYCKSLQKSNSVCQNRCKVLETNTKFFGCARCEKTSKATVYLYNAAPLAPVAGNVTVKFYATDVEGHANQQITADQIQELSVGDTCTVSTKNIDGYTFVGWYIGGDLKSESLKYSFTVEGATTVFALYSLEPEYIPEPEPEVVTEQAFDSLTLIVGFIAIIIAIIGLALVIINKKQ